MLCMYMYKFECVHVCAHVYVQNYFDSHHKCSSTHALHRHANTRVALHAHYAKLPQGWCLNASFLCANQWADHSRTFTENLGKGDSKGRGSSSNLEKKVGTVR